MGVAQTLSANCIGQKHFIKDRIVIGIYWVKAKELRLMAEISAIKFNG